MTKIFYRDRLSPRINLTGDGENVNCDMNLIPSFIKLCLFFVTYFKPLLHRINVNSTNLSTFCFLYILL